MFRSHAVPFNRFSMLAGAAVSAVLASPLCAQLVQPLPAPVGAGSTFAQSINSAGQIAGYSLDDSGNSIPTVWSPGVGGGYSAQALPTIIGNTVGAANGISSTGTIAGYLQPSDQSTATAVIWSPDSNSYSTTPLTGAPNDPGFDSAFAVNAGGNVAGFATTATGKSAAVVWQPGPGGYGAPTLLPAVANQSESGATGINSSGDVAGYATLNPHPFNQPGLVGVVWSNSGGGNYTAHQVIAVDDAQVTAINDFGTGAGVYAGDQPLVCSLFEGDYYATSLDMPFGSTDGASDAVNNFDALVGYAKDSTTDTPGREAAIWLPNDFFWDYLNLDQWLDQTDPTLGAHWTLTEATGISDNWLVTGTGIYDDGAGHVTDQAFVLDVSTLVPEPSALALFALIGGVGTSGRFRRRFTSPRASCRS
jgi:hypothetical protein